MRSKPVRLRDGHAAFRSSNDKYGRMTLRPTGGKEQTMQLPRPFDPPYALSNPGSVRAAHRLGSSRFSIIETRWTADRSLRAADRWLRSSLLAVWTIANPSPT